MIDNMVGKKYGRLTVLEQYYKRVSSGERRDFCFCECECGKTKEIMGKNIRRGLIISCGCYRLERVYDVCHKTNKYYFINDETMAGVDSKGSVFYFSANMFDKIKEYCWSVGNHGYAVTKEVGKNIFLHNLIMDEDGTRKIDHVNRIRNDNRNENLRFTTISQNNQNKEIGKNNSSGIIGVSKRKDGAWHSYISYNGKRINRRSETLKEATIKRLEMEKECYGEFAPQKHLFEEYGIE